MKTHTTNYENTFIETAEDCPVTKSEVPPIKGDSLSIANRQFELLSQNPYKFTSDDIIFQVYADRYDISELEREEARRVFFSRGQPCLRTSPLAKRYGWGIHHNKQGKVALFPCESDAYTRLSKETTSVKAMKSKR